VKQAPFNKFQKIDDEISSSHEITKRDIEVSRHVLQEEESSSEKESIEWDKTS
jgi:hypothetical protein